MLSGKMKPLLVSILFFSMVANAIYIASLLLSAPKTLPALSAPAAIPSPAAQDPEEEPTSPRPAPLGWLSASPVPSGFCVAWSGFSRGMRSFSSAKAIAFSGPLRDRHWLSSTQPSTEWEIRMSSNGEPFSRRAESVREKGYPIIEITSGGAAILARFSSKSEAESMLSEMKERGVAGITLAAASRSAADAIVFLPESANEIEFVRSLPQRIRGSSISEALCPAG